MRVEWTSFQRVIQGTQADRVPANFISRLWRLLEVLKSKWRLEKERKPGIFLSQAWSSWTRLLAYSVCLKSVIWNHADSRESWNYSPCPAGHLFPRDNFSLWRENRYLQGMAYLYVLGRHYYFHFTGEKTVAQEVQIASPKPSSQ